MSSQFLPFSTGVENTGIASTSVSSVIDSEARLCTSEAAAGVDLGAGRGFDFAAAFALTFCVMTGTLLTVGDLAALGVPFAAGAAPFAEVTGMALVNVGVRRPAVRVVDLDDLDDLVDFVDFLEFARTTEAVVPMDVEDTIGGCCCTTASTEANGGVLADRIEYCS